MPYLSVIVPTARVGGIDILLDSLASQSFQDFEFVISDGLAKYRRHLIEEYARDRFIKCTVVEPNPNPFPINSYCKYVNDAVSVATGEILLHLVDYSALPPDLLQRHADFHRADKTGRGGFVGSYHYKKLALNPRFPRFAVGDLDAYVRALQEGRLDEFMVSIGAATDEPSDPHMVDGGNVATYDCDPKLRLPAGPVPADHIHLKNESYRREHFNAIGGCDEAYDGSHGYQDTDLAERLTIHRGVQWTLDPTCILSIVNPRGVLPFLKRTRTIEENRALCESRRATGYKRENKKLRIVMVYGEFCRPGAPFDSPGLYRTAGLTGSESTFFNAAIGLAERGHEVTVICKCNEAYRHPSGAVIWPLHALQSLPSATKIDAVIAWNEPDYLTLAPKGAYKICMQQLNDWAYCHAPGWSTNVDMFVFPSEETMNWHRTEGGLGTQYPVRPDTRFGWLPSSVNLEFFSGQVTRHPHRAIWASSPDRGLHHLLEMWPDVRARVPDAELHVFYELRSLIDRCRNHQDETGRRVRYMESVLPGLLNQGVVLRGFVDNETIAREFQAAAVLPYTFDPSRHTETFAGTVLDACAGGCQPIISDFDCLPSVYGDVSVVIPGPPDESREEWIDEICERMMYGTTDVERAAMKAHAEAHSRQAIAKKWEKFLLVVTKEESRPVIEASSGKSLRVAMVYGEFSSAIHGPFDLEGLYTRQGLTGSESSFFNLARSLAETGHQVVAFADCAAPYHHPSGLEIVPLKAIEALPKLKADAVIAWNEPDYLRLAHPGALRVVDQQLNDWPYAARPHHFYMQTNSALKPWVVGATTDWQQHVDLVVFPSESSRLHHLNDEKLALAATAKVIPNSVDLDLFASGGTRNPHRAIWCSSPDRGLHHLISMWPDIRRIVSDAELRIFYRLRPWLDRARDLGDEVGRRARYIEDGLATLTRGNFGVSVIDLVPNTQMARELQQAGVLVYPCDPVKYTEGFGCSVLDAAAGGCIPIISDVDALGQVHGDASAVVKGNPGEPGPRAAWIDAVTTIMHLAGDPVNRAEADRRMRAHAERHSRQTVAKEWERFLSQGR